MEFTHAELVFIYREMKYASEGLIEACETYGANRDIELGLIESICDKIDREVPTVGAV